ncbi:MAG: ribosome maturation factor RimP [Acutalibacteraceae bacterium]|nr:ribosome maturation factor RimP [Acutalibacteraceae bacterium]
MANAAEKVYGLIKETVEAEGVSLWDVRFLKEGASWYLRVFIDKPEGISIDDCTNVSHAIDPIIDDADPIDVSYYLEVCSPGTERELTRQSHFEASVGKTVKIKLYKALDGVKELTGRLKSAAERVVIETDNGEYELDYKDISKARLCDFE